MNALFWQFLFSMSGTIGFAILFSAPQSEVCFCGLTGALGWIIYDLITSRGFHPVVSTVLAALTLSLFARILAVLRQKPAIVYLITGIFPLVPGSGIYDTAYNLVISNYDLALTKGIRTISIAAAISFGILLAYTVPQHVLNRLFRKR